MKDGKKFADSAFFFYLCHLMRKLNVLELNRLSVDDFKACEKIPLTVVLDDVRSMYNVGSVFRTCDAFRIERVFLCGISATPPHPEIHKTALGAEDSVDWRYFGSALDAVRELKAENYKVYGVEQVEGSKMLDDDWYEGDERIAIVMGNEVKGVDQGVINECDGCLEIPQFGTKHSLNVSTAAGIVIWEVWQRMKK